MMENELIKKLCDVLESEPEPASHIRIEKPDGKILEEDASMWMLCGLNANTKTQISWGNVNAVGGLEKMMNIVLLLAIMAKQCEMLGSGLVNTIPGMTEEMLYKLIDYTKNEMGKKEESNA